MRFGVTVLVGLAVLLVLAQCGVEAKTLLVPREYSGVEEALEEASYGDTVLVSPGRHKDWERCCSDIDRWSRLHGAVESALAYPAAYGLRHGNGSLRLYV